MNSNTQNSLKKKKYVNIQKNLVLSTSQTSSGACMQRVLRFHNPCAYVFFSHGAGERQFHRLWGFVFVAYYLPLKRMRDTLLHSYTLLVVCARLREFPQQCFAVYSAQLRPKEKQR